MATKVLTFDPRIIFDPNLSHDLDSVTLSDGTVYMRVSDTPIDVSTVMGMDITGYSNNWVPMDGMHVERDLIEVMEFTSNITGLVVDGMPAVFNVLDTDTAPDLDVVFTRGVWFLFSDNDDTLIAITRLTYQEDGWFEKLFINEAKPALERHSGSVIEKPVVYGYAKLVATDANAFSAIPNFKLGSDMMYLMTDKTPTLNEISAINFIMKMPNEDEYNEYECSKANGLLTYGDPLGLGFRFIICGYKPDASYGICDAVIIDEEAAAALGVPSKGIYVYGGALITLDLAIEWY